MDLDKCREQNITQYLLNFYQENIKKSNGNIYILPDQDLINKALLTDIYMLSEGWNVYGREKKDIMPPENLTYIYHFYGPNKPWWYMEYDYKPLRLYQKYWTHSIFVITKPYFYIYGFKNRIATKRTIIQKFIIKIKTNRKINKKYIKFLKKYKKFCFRTKRQVKLIKEFYGF